MSPKFRVGLIGILLQFLFYFVFGNTFTLWAKVGPFDGMQLRVGSFNIIHTLEGDGIKNSDKSVNGIPSVPVFPVALTFPEDLRGDSVYTQAYFDFEIPYESQDLAPDAAANQDTIKSRFLTTEEQALVAGNDDWVVSADIKTWSMTFGYAAGWFYTTDRKNRFFKIGYGINIGWVTYEIKLNLCLDGYEVFEELDSSKNVVRSGKCNGKYNIDTASDSGIQYGNNFDFTLYERRTSSYIFMLGNYQIGTIQVRNLDFKERSNEQITFSISYNTIKLFAFTWLI